MSDGWYGDTSGTLCVLRFSDLVVHASVWSRNLPTRTRQDREFFENLSQTCRFILSLPVRKSPLREGSGRDSRKNT